MMLVKCIGSFDSGSSASWHGILEAMGLIPNEFCKFFFTSFSDRVRVIYNT